MTDEPGTKNAFIWKWRGVLFLFLFLKRERCSWSSVAHRGSAWAVLGRRKWSFEAKPLQKIQKHHKKKLESCRFVPTSLSPQEVQKEEKRVRVICNRVQVKIYKRSSVPGISRLWPLKEKGKMKTTWWNRDKFCHRGFPRQLDGWAAENLAHLSR